MAFLFQDQNQGIRNDAPRGMRLSRPFSFIRTLTVGFGIAPNLLTLFPRENSGKKALAGLGLGHPYRRWGLSPRPENIGRPVWATYWELWRMAGAPASTFAIGNRQVPMPPPRNSGVSRLTTLTITAGDRIRGARIQRAGLACRESDSG